VRRTGGRGFGEGSMAGNAAPRTNGSGSSTGRSALITTSGRSGGSPSVGAGASSGGITIVYGSGAPSVGNGISIGGGGSGGGSSGEPLMTTSGKPPPFLRCGKNCCSGTGYPAGALWPRIARSAAICFFAAALPFTRCAVERLTRLRRAFGAVCALVPLAWRFRGFGELVALLLERRRRRTPDVVAPADPECARPIICREAGDMCPTPCWRTAGFCIFTPTRAGFGGFHCGFPTWFGMVYPLCGNGRPGT
jgi:hypothetical protein